MLIKKLILIFFIAVSIAGCQKSNDEIASSFKEKNLIQTIWNEIPLGNQITFFEKKYNLTPREINELYDSEQRVYEISRIKNCDLILLVSKKTKKIYQVEADHKCAIKDDGYGISVPYDSNTTFKELVKKINPQYLPSFTADCLNCGNAFEPMYYMTIDGLHANGFIDVIYKFSTNDGISKWVEKIIEENGGYGSDVVSDNTVDYDRYGMLAIQLWSNDKPNSIALRGLGFK